ncbi:hypothetical protein R6Z07_009455 [Ovis aries]
MTLLLPLWRKAQVHARIRDEDDTLGRLQKYPKIHVSTGEESSGSGPESTQGLRPPHRRERNPERPPRNSHGDWPFLRPPERVPEVPVRNLFSLHCLDFHAEDRLPPWWHVGQPCGKASWESLVGKPRGKRVDPLIQAAECMTLLLPLWRKAQVHVRIRDEDDTLGRLQKYPKIHVSTGEESSGSGPESTQGLRPRHRRERNPERPPRNSHGDWPFLRPPERVPEVPVVSREHLPQLEKIMEVLPSRRDEAHFR